MIFYKNCKICVQTLQTFEYLSPELRHCKSLRKIFHQNQAEGNPSFSWEIVLCIQFCRNSAKIGLSSPEIVNVLYNPAENGVNIKENIVIRCYSV